MTCSISPTSLSDGNRAKVSKSSMKGEIMWINRHFKKMVVIPALFLALMFLATPSFAWGRGERRPYYSPHYEPHGKFVPSLPFECARLIVGGLEYWYWEGMYYRLAADHYVVVPAPIGAVVTTIPPGMQTVVVNGVPYYTINGVTYICTTYGYQVVPQPTIIQVTPPPNVVNSTTMQQALPNAAVANTAQGASPGNNQDAFTVNIPNSKGGYTPVTLKRSGNGFIGPQGEYYTQFPAIDQLKAMYAK